MNGRNGMPKVEKTILEEVDSLSPSAFSLRSSQAKSTLINSEK